MSFNQIEALKLATDYLNTYESCIVKKPLPSHQRVPTIAVLGSLLKQFADFRIDPSFFYEAMAISVNYCIKNKITRKCMKPIKKDLEYLFNDCVGAHPNIEGKG